MAIRAFILIALVACVCIVTSAADHTEASSSSEAVASSSSNGSSASSSSSAKSRITSRKKKCKKVNRCPKNEEFSFCTFSIGRPQFCSQQGQKLRTLDEKQSCKEGCVCKYGYLRNYNGICIPARQCNTDCASSETLDNCPVDSPSDYCPISEDDTGLSERPEPGQCPAPVCKCQFNYRRVNNGSCIPTRECPPFDCSSRPNEEFDPCPPLCPSDDCSQASPTGECPLIGRIGIVLSCQPNCRCIKGYWRKDGICVPYAECPNICPLNEEYVPCKQGVCRAMNCSQIGEPVPCPDIRYPDEQCDSGCICKENYYRNNNGDCVLEDKCKDDNVDSCGSNQEVQCVNDCPPEKTCKNRFIEYSCLQVYTPCKNKCVCKKGYIKNSLGDCIPEDLCDDNVSSCGPNQEVQCVNDCPPEKTCKNRFIEYSCLQVYTPCTNKCVCKEGYVKNDLGECIPEDQCITITECSANEEYSDCKNALCRAQNCSQKGLPVACPAVSKCETGCVCKSGFLKLEYGECVPEDQCPTPEPQPEPVCGDDEYLRIYLF